MTKKDILIFLHIYLLGVKHLVSQGNLNLFREDIYSLLKNYDNFSDFRLKLIKFYKHIPLYSNFIEYLYRINLILDK